MKKKMSIKIISLFPQFLEQYLSFGIVARAVAKKILKFKFVNLRDFGLDLRGTVDDRPYGGGLGMVLRPDVLHKAITFAKKKELRKKKKVILLTPQGKVLTQKIAQELTKQDELIFVCGRYEGFDERIRKFVNMELSIGDYVLMGGELAALVATETVIRLIPGVLGKDDSSLAESHSAGMLEYPQYTKPEIWEVSKKKIRVPKVLLTGNHAKINAWRESEALKRTKKRRPDLIK